MSEDVYDEFRLSMIGKPVEIGEYEDTEEFPGEPITLILQEAGVLEIYSVSSDGRRVYKLVGGEAAHIDVGNLLIITVRE